jgi:hypothetical protein
LLNTPSAGEPNDRSFDDFASGHSFDVFEPPKHVTDCGLKLEHVMLAVVLFQLVHSMSIIPPILCVKGAENQRHYYMSSVPRGQRDTFMDGKNFLERLMLHCE